MSLAAGITTNYHYDANGNLTGIEQPATSDDPSWVYHYSQRNLLTQSMTDGSSGVNVVAEFQYNGMGDRILQIDYSDGSATGSTIRYTNDPMGLTQVLVTHYESEEGETQTANLFGLSLIQQDDGSQTRTLLADGLGSVRVEMVGDAVDSATTYESYSKLLARSGDSKWHD